MEKSPSQNGKRASRSIQSIEIGFGIVRALESGSKTMSLGEIARTVGMPGGSVHPYLVSFCNVGILRQDLVTGQYGLGPYAVELGLAGIRQLDVFEAAKPVLTQLRDDSGLSVYLSIWGNKGPAIIQRYDGDDDAPIAVRVGWVLPVLSSAMGQISLAWLPRTVTRTQIEQERRSNAPFAAMSDAQFEKFIKDKVVRAREHGFAMTESRIAEGYAAVSAPILDHDGALLAIVTALGLRTKLAPDPEDPRARMLVTAARKISEGMGYFAPVTEREKRSVSGYSKNDKPAKKAQRPAVSQMAVFKR